MVEGSSLITNEKLLLIDSNAKLILNLQESNNSLDSRILVLENSVNNEIKTQVSDHNARLIVLETDNNNIKNSIGNLQESINLQLTEIKGINNEHASQINNLSLKLNSQETTISTLSTKVEENTNAILQLKSVQYGSGLSMVDNTLDVKINPSADNLIKITESGLMVDFSGDVSTEVENIIDAKIEESLKWDSVS